MSIKITGLQQAQDALKKELDKLSGGEFALVGIHESAGQVESGDITMAKLGAIQHFGAEIDHPGGTKYAKQADGSTRFVPDSYKGSVSGVTGAHKIRIPARPWLDVGVERGAKEYLETIKEGIEEGLSGRQIVNQIGALAVGYVQQYIVDLKEPANSASTQRKKKSSNPLVDTGAMGQSVTYTVSSQKPEDGVL